MPYRPGKHGQGGDDDKSEAALDIRRWEEGISPLNANGMYLGFKTLSSRLFRGHSYDAKHGCRLRFDIGESSPSPSP
jgi:hypothetical protein